jgi:hypothetical protein
VTAQQKGEWCAYTDLKSVAISSAGQLGMLAALLCISEWTQNFGCPFDESAVKVGQA